MKQDPKLVAAKEDNEREVKHICSRFKIPIAAVRKVMMDTGKDGRPCRSRKIIYAALRKEGYVINVKKKTA